MRAAACRSAACRSAAVAVLTLSLAACQPGGTSETAGGVSADAQIFDGIAATETISLVGTEPFWGGTVTASELNYTTPENQAGQRIPVRRFAGNNGLGFSGTLDGKTLDLAITPGDCSDGMSDRRFPFVATLRIGEEQRNGCAWTRSKPFTGPQNP